MIKPDRKVNSDGNNGILELSILQKEQTIDGTKGWKKNMWEFICLPLSTSEVVCQSPR